MELLWIQAVMLMILCACDGTLVDLQAARTRYARRLLKHNEKYRNNLVLSRIKNARRRNATCMDGSDAKYYISRQWDSPNWIIHLQAGGSCISFDECKDRAKGPLGSSVPLDRRITGEFTLSNDPGINPTFHRWNKVVIPYCSGDVFVGRQLKRNHPYRMPMLGHYIIVAVIEDLIKKHHINSVFTQILFGGTSAGGIGVLANIDHVQKLTFPAEVKGYNDGGWFTLFPNFGENYKNGLPSEGLPKFFDVLTELFEDKWDGFVDESCRKQMPKAAACLYGELAVSFISSPLYVMVSQWDSYQLTRMTGTSHDIITLPPRTKRELHYVSAFGNNTFRSINSLLQRSKTGIFSPACYAHTFFTSCIDGILCGYPRGHKYSIEGHTAYAGLSEWFRTNGELGSYVDQTQEHPACNPSCCSIYCSKCSVSRTLTKDSQQPDDLNTVPVRRKNGGRRAQGNRVEVSNMRGPYIYYPGDAVRLEHQTHFLFIALLFCGLLLNVVI